MGVACPRDVLDDTLPAGLLPGHTPSFSSLGYRVHARLDQATLIYALRLQPLPSSPGLAALIGVTPARQLQSSRSLLNC
jgi:hypothetical protein